MSFLDTTRFQFFITLAMRAITFRDAMYLRKLEQQGHTAPPSSPANLIRATIPYGRRTLEAAHIPHENTAFPPIAAILLLHGIGEQLAYWEAVQLLLARHGIVSMIFHYSRYGRNGGSVTPQNLHLNAHSAYAALRDLVPKETPIFLLGFSMGTAVSAEVAGHLSPPSSGVILCEAFTTLRQAATCVVSPGFLSLLLPNIWRTIDTVKTLNQPLLIVHSHDDELFPAAFARSIYCSAQSHSAHPVELALVHNFSHNAPYLRPELTYWQPILDFIQRHAVPAGNPATAAFTPLGNSAKSP